MAREKRVRIGCHAMIGIDLDAAVEAFLNYCRAKNLSPNSITYYGYRLNALRSYLQAEAPETAPGDLTPQVIRGFVADQTKSHSASTANHSICALKAFFNYLVEDGFLETSPMAAVKKVKCRAKIIETFSSDQVEAVLKACGRSFSGVRDRAMLLVLFDSGLRATELCTLHLADVDWTEQTLRVLGKGDKERIVPFGQAAKQALNQYVARRGRLDIDNLFVTCYAEPVSRYRLAQIVRARCKSAGITGVRCSPHTFRHTFAVTYLRAGGDVFSLQKLLGHSDLTMTRRYAELSQADIRLKHRQFSPADGLKIASDSGQRKRLA